MIKKTVFALVILSILLAVAVIHTIAKAEDTTAVNSGSKFRFGFTEDAKSEDCQFYLRGKDDRSELGTGFCYGPLLNMQYGKRWLGDFISISGLVTVSPNETIDDDKRDTGFSVGVQGVNLLGLRAGGFWDPLRNLYFIGAGISFNGLASKLLE